MLYDKKWDTTSTTDKFKSAEELGFTSKSYYRALIKVLYMLENNEFEWVTYCKISEGKSKKGFSMATTLVKTTPYGYTESNNALNCGTVGCIAGWAAFFDENIQMKPQSTMLMIPNIVAEADDPSRAVAWSNLITPNGWKFRDYSLSQAAHALRTYLETGMADWKEMNNVV
jgi:hypothetical protein